MGHLARDQKLLPDFAIAYRVKPVQGIFLLVEICSNAMWQRLSVGDTIALYGL